MAAEELTDQRKAELEAESRKKIQFMEQEYWRVRNGKQRFMRCPFCMPFAQVFKRKNWIDGKRMCCSTFARAFEAILDRQAEVDKTASAARIIHAIGKQVQN